MIDSVGGLPLPEALLAAIGKGRWKPPADRLLAEVFDDEPADPRFYDPSEMVRQNRSFQGWSQEELQHYLYIPNPGDGVEPARAVIIGDLGPDSPIVLDYRLSQDRPRVLHLHAGGWHVIAADIETLLRLLGL